MVLLSVKRYQSYKISCSYFFKEMFLMKYMYGNSRKKTFKRTFKNQFTVYTSELQKLPILLLQTDAMHQLFTIPTNSLGN